MTKKTVSTRSPATTTPKSYPKRGSKAESSAETPTKNKDESSTETPTATVGENLQDTIKLFKSRIEQLEGTVITLHGTVTNLENKIIYLEAENAKISANYYVSACVNDTLRRNIDNLEQYQRRSCMVVEGLPTTDDEKIPSLKGKIKDEVINQVAKNGYQKAQLSTEFDLEFDKCHRIGPIKEGGKQNAIIRFKSHGFREKLYMNRTKGKNVKIRLRTSLTKRRSDLLMTAQHRISDLPEKSRNKIAFTYADFQGNLKIKLNAKIDNKWNFEFNSEQELNYALCKIDYDAEPYSDYED